MNSYSDYFKYHGNFLTCDGVQLKNIALEYGTPTYVYTERGFVERFMEIDKALDGLEHLVCYSIKSNSNINILRVMKEIGSGMDVVSGGELYRALKAGIDPKKVVFAGVGKTEEEIAYAIDSKILMFNCESFPEIEAINRISLQKNTATDIAIRVNPDVDANTHHYITTGKKENKFGIAMEPIRENFSVLKSYKGIRLRGIQCHIGSQILSSNPFIMAIEKLIGFISELKDSGFKDIEFINLGGGYGIRYNDEAFFPMKELAADIKRLVKPLGLKLVVEPGRYLSGNNGILLVKVLYKKISGSKTFLITDGAMNDLIRPSLYGAYQEILNCERREGTEAVDVVGPVCESGDFFAKERDITYTEKGDYCSIMSAGAYGMSMASRYNSRRLPAEVMVSGGGKCSLIRRRDTYEDMIKNEIEI